MNALLPLLEWIETTQLATAVRNSLVATSFLSGLHIVGMVLASGAALVRGLHWHDPSLTRAVRTGLLVSVISGALLVAPRISGAAYNGIFIAKMLTLMAAIAADRWFYRSRPGQKPPARVPRTLSALMWVGVAALGCAFILIE